MIIVMRTGAAQEEIDEVKKAVAAEGLETYEMVGEERIVLGVVGVGVERVQHVELMPGVEQCIRVSKPYKLASSEHHPDRSSIRVGPVGIGAGSPLAVIAGPCAVESREQVLATARWVKREGATVMRGGAFKPRSSPYAFQGLGVEGLKLLAEAREETGLPVVSEITDPADVAVFDQYVDMLQVGARNMANFVLLKAVGRSRKPVLLKRGLSATIDELLMAAEYILSSGNPNVILCERGIRTFETATRNTLDLSAVPVIQERTHLPILVDPSHGTGHRPLVRPLAVAGAAVGADGIIIEVHPDPPRRAPTPSSRCPSPSSATSWTTCAGTSTCASRPHRTRPARRSRPRSGDGCAPASMTSTRGSRRCWRSAPNSRWQCSRRASRVIMDTTWAASASSSSVPCEEAKAC